MSKILGGAITLGAALSLSIFTSSARADVNLTIGIGNTAYSLGTDNPGDDNSGGQAVTAVDIVTELLTLSLGQTGVAGTGGISGTLNRSDNVFSSLPAPTQTGDDVLSPGQTSVTLPIGYGYTYLEAKYANNEMVWDIAGIAPGTTIDIPSTGFGAAGLSDETFLDRTTPSAPDGALTLRMLGGSFMILSAVRRKLARE
jgi:hypothetical protein